MKPLAIHVSTEVDARERGYRFGLKQHAKVRNTVIRYQELIRDESGLSDGDVKRLTRRLQESLASSRSALVAEIEGIAEGTQVDPDLLMAANARTEFLAGSRRSECSVLAALDSHKVVLGQNWDWLRGLRQSLVVWEVHLANGSWLATLTEAGILAKIGLNSHGLAVGLNVLSTSSDVPPHDGTMPIHFMLRILLEEGMDLHNARAVVDRHQYSASSAMTLASKNPGEANAATVEISPVGTRWQGHSEGRLAHTNHFLDESMVGACTLTSEERGWSEDRLRVLQSFDGPATSDELWATLSLHDAVGRTVCDHGENGTQATVVMDVEAQTMAVSTGKACIAEPIVLTFPHSDRERLDHEGCRHRVNTDPLSPFEF